MQLDRLISGGQTGADQAGWRAAKAAGITTGGWMPKGFLTEDGPRPEFAELYGAAEHPSPKYPPRTRANVLMSDVTLIFDTSPGNSIDELSAGSRLATEVCIKEGVPSLIVAVRLGEPPSPRRPAAVRGWFADRNWRRINVAGNRESRAPGIGAWVEAYLAEVFRLLRES